MKKPFPPMARSVDSLVLSKLPCENDVSTELNAVPLPTWLDPDVPFTDWYRTSSNVARLPLNPTVFTFAMLLPTTLIDELFAIRPLMPEKNELNIVCLLVNS